MISILIPTTVKTKPYLDMCVKAIEKNTTLDYEIYIRPNGEGTDFPQGQCRAVNSMAKLCKGDWIMVINDDMYCPPGWHDNINWAHDCFSPNLVEPVDNAGSAHPFLKFDGGLTLDEFKQDKVDVFCTNNEERVIENGFNFPFIMKRELWEIVGGYDLAYDPWGSNSDSDLQYKLEIAGVTPKRNRGMLVYHFGSKSGTFDPDKQSYWQKNWDYFVDKWGFDREDTVWEHNLHIPLDKLKYRPDWSIYADTNDR